MTRDPTEMELRVAKATYARMIHVMRARYFSTDPALEQELRRQEDWDFIKQKTRDDWIAYARTAIQAMREPTIEMEIAGTEYWATKRAYEDQSGANWRAMIDAASPPVSP